MKDSSGGTLNTYGYDIWGNLTSKTEAMPQPFRYAGELQDDESGLIYLRARYYDPAVARFITEDTYTGKINNPLSLNLYTYVGNNPLVHSDPTGHCWICSEDTLKKIDEKVTSFCNWFGCKEFGQAIIDAYPIEQSIEVPIMAAPKVIEEAPAAWAATKHALAKAWTKVKGWVSKDYPKVGTVLTKQERISIYYQKLGEAPAAKSASEGLDLVNRTMDEVEDAYSGVAKATDPGLKYDGRMYGPRSDFIVSLPDGTLRATTFGNIIDFASDGTIKIYLKNADKTAGELIFMKEGAK